MAKTRLRLGSLLPALLLTLAPLYAQGAEIVHVVGKGQTLGRIAKRYHVTVEALREANGLKPGDRIHPGLSLVVPTEHPKVGEVTAVHKGKAERGQDRGRKAAEEAFHGPHKRGVVRMIRGTEKLEVQTLTRHGHLAPAALSSLTRMLRFGPTGAMLPIDPRLAALIGQVSDHFGGRPLHVVSGYRPYSPAQYTRHSNHNVGHAIDFSVEGIPNTVVRDFCRTFRSAGVGYYPNSTFVHLDVRAGKAYWIDYSRPGEAPHYDSPGSQQDADEAAGDVEPRVSPASDSGRDGEPSRGSPNPSGSAETPSPAPPNP